MLYRCSKCHNYWYSGSVRNTPETCILTVCNNCTYKAKIILSPKQVCTRPYEIKE